MNKKVKITSYTEDGIYQKLYNIYFPVKKETGTIGRSITREQAKKKGLFLSNPYDDIEIKVNGCKPPNNLKAESGVYLPEEKEKLFRQLNKRLMQIPFETDAYAVFLLFKLGLRIGEAVALKWADSD